MDSSRRTSSRRDIPTGSSRGFSNRSRPLDLIRLSAFNRAYSARDVLPSNSEYQERQNDSAAGQRVPVSRSDRVYSTHDARQGYSNASPHFHTIGQSSAGYPDLPKDLEEVIQQRGGKTSSHSEIQLGYQEGLRGGLEPRDYLTSREEQEYDEAPNTPDRRTTAQNNAVRLYNRAQEALDRGNPIDVIEQIVERYRREYNAEEDLSPRGERGSHPRDYLTSREEHDYDEAPNTPDRRTTAQNNAVWLYNRVREVLDQGGTRQDLEYRVQQYRQQLEAGPSHQSDQRDRRTDIYALVDRIIERSGYRDNYQTFQGDIRDHMRSNKMSWDEYQTIAKPYFEDKGLEHSAKKSIRKLLIDSYTE